MTSETRLLIEIPDVEGVELECPDCAAKILYPVEKYKDYQLAAQCPNCRAPWFSGNKNMPGSPAEGMNKITALIGALQDATARPDILARIHLLIASHASDALLHDSSR